MEEVTVTSQKIQSAEVAEDIKNNGVVVEITGENTVQIKKEGKKEEITTLDGNSIKVENDSLDVNQEATKELLESQEKVEELEHELQRVSALLKESVSKNTHLKDELFLKNETHQENAIKHENLELNLEKMLEKISETEERHNLELTTLQDALHDQEATNKELTDAKEASDNLSFELETSKKEVEDLKLDLLNSSEEAVKLEDLHKQSGLLAEIETKKAFEFERLLELAKSSAVEMQGQMGLLQDELKIVYESFSENQKLEETLKRTNDELYTVKSQVEDSEQRLASKEGLIGELTRELEFLRGSDCKVKEDVPSLENLLELTRENLEEKLLCLEDVELKLEEEVRAKEQVEEQLKFLEKEMEIVQEELARVKRRNETLGDVVKELEEHLATAETRLKEEIELSSQKDLERDALKKSFEKLEFKKTIFHLENQVKELELQLSDAKSKEKVIEGAAIEAKDEIIKSRDFESLTSTPSEMNSKKDLAEALSSNAQIQTPEVSPITTLKFILGVILVSIIFGVILGKRY